jgi:hypothetical protein
LEADNPADMYEGIWITLCELASTLGKLGVAVPAETSIELRSAKALISGYRTDPEAVHVLSQVQAYLKRAERTLVEITRKAGYPETIEEFLERLDKVRRGEVKPRSAGGEIRFIPGLPRSGRWIRIRISTRTPLSRIEEVALKSRVSVKPHEEGYVLASGRSEDLREFVRILRSKTQASAKFHS